MTSRTVRSLPQLLSFIVDNRGRTCPTSDSGIPLIATNCLKEGKREAVFENIRYVDESTYATWFRAHPKPGDILFVCKGSPGRVAVVPDPVPYCIAQDMVALRVDPTVINANYLYYRLRSPDVQQSIGNMHVGTMIPHFKKGDFGKLEFTVHDNLSEQQAIAGILRAIDDKIAANDRIALLTQEMLATLHKQAIITETSVRKPFFEVFDVDFGEAFKGEHFSESPIGRPLIRIRDLKTFFPQVWTTESCPNETIVRPGDVLVGMDAEFRATWWLGEPGLLNQRVCRVRGKYTGSAFVAEALRNPLRSIENEKSGTTVIHLNKSDLVRSQILMPPGHLLAKFEEKGEPLVHSRVALAVENRRLAHMRDQLLPLLMSGKVRVRDAEKIAEEVV